MGGLVGKYVEISPDVRLGEDVRIYGWANLYGCAIGDRTKIGPFVEIQRNATVGADCKISSHSFICEGVRIADRVFIGHGVTFTNDMYPRATGPGGALQTEEDWTVVETHIEAGASIGSGTTLLAGITVGAGAIVGPGSVLTTSVGAEEICAGHPARYIPKVEV